MKNNWNIDPKIKEGYIKACQSFMDDELFKNFKRNKDYGMILEGNQYDVGLIAANYIEQRGGWEYFQHRVEKFKENDSIGNPEILEWWPVSPATLRYVNTLWEIKLLLGDFQPKRILEIGGGYGGLCKTLSVEYDFVEYTNIDLPEAEALFTKYISHFPNLNTNNKLEGKYDLFIADSSLAECDHETQLYYAKLGTGCPYVFITYNAIHQDGNHENLQKIKALFKDYHMLKTPPIMTQTGLQSFSHTFLFRKEPFI